MSNSMLLILVLAAISHAIWNALGKKIEERDAFFTLILGVSVILYLPLAIYLGQSHSIPVQTYKWLLLSTISEILYFVALAKAYRTASLSNAYPIVRGTAPLVTTLLIFIFFGLTIKLTGLVGIVLIVCGILFINQQKFSFRGLRTMFSEERENLKWIILAGSFSACSSVIDGMGAATTSGLLFKYVVYIGMFLGKVIIDRRQDKQVSYIKLCRRYPVATFFGAVFVFISNSFAVYAMETTPITYVAAVREMGIVFATLIGIIWLKEKVGLVKWISIILIVAGVIIIKLS